MSQGGWFYIRSGQQVGPVDFAVLQNLLAAGQVQPGELVWTQGMPNWAPAQAIPALAGAASPPPLAPPPMAVPYATPQPPDPSQGIGQDLGMRMLLPVGRSGWAIAAGYLGLLSILALPAPFAIVCAILAMVDMRKNPHKHGMGRAIFGLAMGILGTVGLGIALIAAMSG